MSSKIIEIGFEINTQEDLNFLESLFNYMKIAYYIQPTRNPPWTSLADLEAACEGK